MYVDFVCLPTIQRNSSHSTELHVICRIFGKDRGCRRATNAKPIGPSIHALEDTFPDRCERELNPSARRGRRWAAAHEASGNISATFILRKLI